MSATGTPPRVLVVARATTPHRAVAWLALRQIGRGAVVVTVVAAGMSALVVATYAEVVGSAPGGVASLAALADNPAIRTLFGAPVAPDDAGGFAVWRTGTAIAVLVGVWAVLATTRVLRGEEEAGRFDLLLGGVLPIATVTSLHLAVLLGAVLVVGTGTGIGLVAAGAAPGGAVLHGAGVAAVGIIAVALAGVAAQLVSGRGGASGGAVAVLLGGLLVRMVGDGVDALGWIRWLSPFGLVALVEPFGAGRVLPLVVLCVAGSALAAVVPVLAARRDVGAGLRAARPPRRGRGALLGSLFAFAVRGALAPVLGWAVGIGAFFLLIGLVSRSMTDFLTANPLFAELAAQAGFLGLGSVQGYAATLFALLAVPAGAFTAVRTGALAASETGRRLDLLLAGPVTRRRLLGGHVLVTAGGAAVLTAVAGVALWAGATMVGSPLTFPEALAGAFNTVPITALGLGAAVLALGITPGAVVPVGVLPGAGGFMWTVVADSIDAPHWVAGVSPFTHLAAVPAVGPNVPGAVVMGVVALFLGCAGAMGYERRDLR